MKAFWLDVSEVLDALRVFPRLLVLWYGYWMGQVVGRTMDWYFFGLAPIDRTTQVTAVISVIVPGVFGLGVYLTKIYMAGGRIWGKSLNSDGLEGKE